ncbi:Ig lambda chain V-VI region AR [Microtus ochrogaster]|uniref:Ig lambda chain V-VI region AR n=1 Tax=Microtus ochrogaster TaxID=79684 RepID=A0A8J6GMW4_MICOH|nr:Ig lambda chain V-VI region AR [Microtus ochrogaster]
MLGRREVSSDAMLLLSRADVMKLQPKMDTGSCAQFVLTQPNSVSGSLGTTVTISCKRSSGNIGSSYVYWFQQHIGSPPTNVMYDYNKRPSGIPDRFSGSIDSSSNSASLTITDLQVEDEADYYCQSYDSDYKHSHENYGEVRQKLPRAPAVKSLVKKTIVISCFLQKYFYWD